MTEWSRDPERGAAWLVQLMLWLIRHMCWFATGVVLPGISVWFFIRSAASRAASREYLSLALRRPATGWDVFRHIHVFAHSILDRVLLLTPQAGGYQFDVTGLEYVEAVAAAGHGGVLLGGHLGSFGVLRGLAAQCPVPVKMLMFRGNAGPFTRALERLDPAFAADIIPIGDMGSMLRVHEAVKAGALVGLLADRAPGRTRRVTAPFFGRPAAFPIGPFVLAASLGVPVLTVRGVRVAANRYKVEFAPFAEQLHLGRDSRNADLSAWVARYAQWLEAGCRAYPFNWFNFYSFWGSVTDEPINSGPIGAARRADTVRAAEPHGATLDTGATLPLDDIMARLAKAPQRQARFVEDKRLAALSAPLHSEGELAYRKPDHLEKITTAPQYESLVIDGSRLTVKDGPNAEPKVVDVGRYPEVGMLVATIRGAVSGDLSLLRRYYDISGTGTTESWSIMLHPRDPAVAKLVRQVQLSEIANCGESKACSQMAIRTR